MNEAGSFLFAADSTGDPEMKSSHWFMMSCLMLMLAGCGGGVSPGVATGPDTAEPAQTEEVIANEAESAKNAASQNE
jgi:hypothetical protein